MQEVKRWHTDAGDGKIQTRHVTARDVRRAGKAAGEGPGQAADAKKQARLQKQASRLKKQAGRPLQPSMC